MDNIKIIPPTNLGNFKIPKDIGGRPKKDFVKKNLIESLNVLESKNGITMPKKIYEEYQTLFPDQKVGYVTFLDNLKKLVDDGIVEQILINDDPKKRTKKHVLSFYKLVKN